MSIVDMNGKIFNRWTVLSIGNRDKNGHILWLCRCLCGVEKNVYGVSLRSGVSKSCGCLNREIMSSRISHGHTKNGVFTSEYTAWMHMRNRCQNPKYKKYCDYGGRGITICDRWINSFDNFLHDMGCRPSPKHSLDRLDNEGNYEPNNCAWRTKAEQNRNKRDNRWLESNGIKMVLTDWANRWGIPYQSIQKTLKAGRLFDELFDFHEKKIPLRKIRIYAKYNSKSKKIDKVVNGEVVKTYESISLACEGENISKFTILNQASGIKYKTFKDGRPSLKVPYDYSIHPVYYRYQ